MKKKYVTVRIDRTRWQRGKYTIKNGSKLLVSKGGRMCCLGFVCLVLGAKKRDILHAGYPAGTMLDLPGLTERNGQIQNTGFSEDAASINDDTSLSDRQREIQLRKLAKQNGFIFKFVN